MFTTSTTWALCMKLLGRSKFQSLWFASVLQANLSRNCVITQVYWQCGRTLYVLQCSGLYKKKKHLDQLTTADNINFFLTSRCTNKRCQICTIHTMNVSTQYNITFNCSSPTAELLQYSCVHAFGINSFERTQDHRMDLVVSWALVRKHQNLHRPWRLTTDANQAAGHGANRCVLLQETVLLTNRQESRALCIILHALNIWCSWQVLYSFFPNIASEMVPEWAAFLTLSSPLLHAFWNTLTLAVVYSFNLSLFLWKSQ